MGGELLLYYEHTVKRSEKMLYYKKRSHA